MEYKRITFNSAFSQLGLFALLFTWSLLSGLFLFYALRLVSPRDSAIFYPIFMLQYPSIHPFPYLISIAAIFACFGLVWMKYCSALKFRNRVYSAFLMLCGCILIFAPIGAMWWILHDIEAGFMPTMSTLWFNIKRGLKVAPWVMLHVTLLSMPLSALAFAVAMRILFTVNDYWHGKPQDELLPNGILKWGRNLLFVFVPVALFQVLGILVYLTILEEPSTVTYTFASLGYWLFLASVHGIPMVLGLTLIAFPFLKMLSWSKRHFPLLSSEGR